MSATAGTKHRCTRPLPAPGYERGSASSSRSPAARHRLRQRSCGTRRERNAESVEGTGCSPVACREALSRSRMYSTALFCVSSDVERASCPSLSRMLAWAGIPGALAASFTRAVQHQSWTCGPTPGTRISASTRSKAPPTPPGSPAASPYSPAHHCEPGQVAAAQAEPTWHSGRSTPRVNSTRYSEFHAPGSLHGVSRS